MALVQRFHPRAGEVGVVFLARRAWKKSKKFPPILGTRVDSMPTQPGGSLDTPTAQRRFRNRIDRPPGDEAHHSRLLPMRKTSEVNIDFLSRVEELEVHRTILCGAIDESRPPTPSGPEAEGTSIGRSWYDEWKLCAASV